MMHKTEKFNFVLSRAPLAAGFTLIFCRSAGVLTRLLDFQRAYGAMWGNMLGQSELDNFYRMLHDDIVNATEPPQQEELAGV